MALRTRESRFVLAAGVAAVVVGLSLTGPAVFSPGVRAFFADSPDSVDIARYAAQATPGDVLRWWSGVWIQASAAYYRPLSSLVLWVEYRAFGTDFTAYAVVSWILHGVICLILFSLGVRVLPGGTTTRSVLAAIAVLLFNVRWAPLGTYWLSAPIAFSVVAWFPAQTGQLALLFGLGALTVFDDSLHRGQSRRRWLAAGLWGVALLCKETPVVLPAVAAVWATYRHGRTAWRLWMVPPANPAARRFAPGAFWTLVLPAGLFAGCFLAMRGALVPDAWGGGLGPGNRLFVNWLRHSFDFPLGAAAVRGPWVVIVSAFVALCLYVYARLPRRPGALWLLLVVVVGSGVLAQVFAGNFALITPWREVRAISSLTILLLGLATLLHVRRGPSWPLLAMVFIVQLPILEMQGPHYEYWPAAFWALFHASLLGFLWQCHTAGTLQWRVHAAPADDTTSSADPADLHGRKNELR